MAKVPKKGHRKTTWMRLKTFTIGSCTSPLWNTARPMVTGPCGIWAATTSGCWAAGRTFPPCLSPGSRRCTPPIKRPPPKRRRLPPPEGGPLLLQMREFLQSNSNRIVTLDELFRAINGQLKRTRIVKLLTDAPWCVQVDRGTYYWNGTSGMVEEQVAKVSMG